MKLRAACITVVKVATIAIATGACGPGAGGKLTVDTPAMPYQAPDIDDITGIDSDAPATAPAPAAGSGEQK